MLVAALVIVAVVLAGLLAVAMRTSREQQVEVARLRRLAAYRLDLLQGVEPSAEDQAEFGVDGALQRLRELTQRPD